MLDDMFIPLIVLGIVFVLISVRRIGGFKLDIWLIMLFGAIAVLLTGQISPHDALMSVNLDVIIFLFGMFVIGRALEDSGYLSHLSYKFFRRAKNSDMLLFMSIMLFGFLSSFLMNDTVAIIGTPVVLLLARKHDIHAKPFLLGLAFSVTIGSVMSPIGNPQNLLIAIGSGIQNPFVTFMRFLFIPTIINLIAAYVLIRIFYHESFRRDDLKHSQEPIHDRRLAFLSKVSLITVLLLILIKISLVLSGLDFDLELTYIAVLGMLPILLSRRRVEMIRKIDWHTLIFFVSMFILMQSVWDTGIFQSAIERWDMDVTSMKSIFMISIILSQLISNVPLVALYMPILGHAGSGTEGFIALAAASTIAGNLFILGAASTVIIIQNAERRSKETITFFEFAKIGVILTAINALVYYAFLVFF